MSAFIIKHNINLHPFNTFGIHAISHFFTIIQSPHEIQLLLQNPEWKNFPKLILGAGSNILFTEDYKGLIIKNEIKGIECLEENENEVLLKVGAGENWHALVLHCIRKGYAGIENLSLIPGTVGAAPIQNIGAYGTELKDVFYELEAINLSDGIIKTFNQAECQFAYRHSIFKIPTNCYMILNVTLRLLKKPIFNTEYSDLQAALKMMNLPELSIKAISDAVIAIRQKKLPDPNVIGNAGSFFKNPLISKEDFKDLQSKFLNVPYFHDEVSDQIKIPAAWLIEQCGWKGKRIGNKGVYEKQALVIVNYGEATGAEIWQLAQQIQQSVQEKFGISLIPEVNVF